MSLTPGGGSTAPGVAVRHYQNPGAPTSGTNGTLAGIAPKGSICTDTTNARAYINVNTQASPTWVELVRVFKNAGAPVDTTTLANVVAVSDLLIDTTNNNLYIVTGSSAAPVYKLFTRAA
jgi:hypothetical protein